MEGGLLTANLLIPGFVFIDLTARGRSEKPDGAWAADPTADFALERIAAGVFYILFPDGEVTRETDAKRIRGPPLTAPGLGAGSPGARSCQQQLRRQRQANHDQQRPD
jgi:hypothetical protein